MQAHSFFPVYWWMAEVPYYWYCGKWQHSLLEWLDNVSDPRVLKLVPQSSWVDTNEIYCYSDDVRYGRDWVIAFWWLESTFWTQDLVNSFDSTDTFYVVDFVWSVSKCLKADATTPWNWVANATPWIVSLDSNNDWAYPYLRSSSFISTWIYICGSNKVYLFSFATETISTEAELPEGFIIKHISEFWQTITVYTDQWIVYFLQKAWTNWELVIIDSMDMKENISGWYNVGWIDYIIADQENTSKLYLVSGKSYELLYSEDLDLDAIGNDRFDFNVTYANNFVGAHTNNAIFLTGWNWFYLVWSLKWWYPRQISHYNKWWFDVGFVQNRLLSTCHSLYIFNNDLYCSARVNNISRTITFTFDLNDITWANPTADFAPNGLWTTYTFDAWMYVNPKDAKEVWVWAIIPSSTSIQISYSIDRGPYETLATLDSSFNGKSVLTMNRQFYDIKFRVTHTQIAWTETPEIFDFVLYYDIDKRRWN